MRRAHGTSVGGFAGGTGRGGDPRPGPFDLLVVGLGPAGATCVLQGIREGLRVVAVGDQPIGGLLPAARRLDNLPGWPGGVGGTLLARRIARQVAAAGVPVLRGTVASLRVLPGGAFEADLADGRRLTAETVCLAPGTSPAPLPWKVDGGATPARDIRDLPARLIGRRVVVVGGGDAALDTALAARDRGAEVSVLIRGTAPRAAPGLEREAEAAGIDLRLGVVATGLAFRRGVWSVATAAVEIVTADHVVACIGRVPRDDLVRTMNGVAGAFVVGDVGRDVARFAALAMADGQAAALAAAARVRGLAGEGRR